MIFNETIGQRKALHTFFKSQDNPHECGLFEFKGTIYKTHNVHNSGSLSLNYNEVRALVDQIKINYSEEEDIYKELNVVKYEKLLDDVKGLDSDSQKEIIQNELTVSKFNKVDIRFADDICLFWDHYTKEMFYLQDVQFNKKYKSVRDKKKGHLLSQTPLWVLSEETEKYNKKMMVCNLIPLSVKGDGFKLFNQHSFQACPNCSEGRLRKLRSFDSARTLYSMNLLCDKCTYSQKLPFLKNWRLAYASTNLTSAFVVGTYNEIFLNYRKKEIKPLLKNCRNIKLDLIETFDYCSKIRIKEVLLGFWKGFQVNKFFPVDKLGIDLETNGLNIVLKDEYYKQAKSYMKKIYENSTNKIVEKLNSIEETDVQFKKLVLHSLAHSIIMKLSIYSGMDIGNFDYLYDAPKNRVIIYEVAPGGMGACKILTEIHEESEENIVVDFIEKIKNSLKDCDCDNRCKYCLAFVGCKEFSNNLNRFALGPLFNLSIEEMSWGY